MTDALAREVLRRSAEHFEMSPGSWCTGFGNLLAWAGNSSNLPELLCDPGSNGCIDTIIRCYSMIVVGDAKKAEVVSYEAIKILCKHHRIWWILGRRTAIFSFNDHRCRTAANAAAFIRAPLGTAASDQDLPNIAAPGLVPTVTSSVKEKVLALTLVLALFAGIFNGTSA